MPTPETAVEIAQAVRARTVSAGEVTEAALARVERANPALNAFVHVAREAALRDADAVDAAVARGEDPGPLAGVPIGAKDLEPVAGMPFTAGSRLYRERVAQRDSVQITRLRAAGAIVLGKTNTPEFGYKGFTNNHVFGPTGNPWDPRLTPGGSSGGSAAAVAAGMVPLCTASDGGGSIRIPASFCGCYGIKPTAGRIPLAGETYPHWATHSTLGPVSRTVRDAARYLDVATGPHPDDLNSLDSTGHGFEAAVLAGPPPIRRVAWSKDLGYAVVDPEVASIAEAAARRLAHALGAELVETHPGFEDPMPTWFVLGAPGDVHFLDTLTSEQRELLEPGFRAFAENARGLMAYELAGGLQARHTLNRTMTAFFGNHDLLLTPTVSAPPFAAEGPPPASIAGRPVGPAGFIPFTYPFNITGHPAASVPAGRDARGMPVGLQIVGPRFDDARVLAVSAVYESSAPWEWPSLT
jgi:aspartyl-tRNA(Asn)/glutamyl-tRNA(Gln) amidotransferase subunit A